MADEHERDLLGEYALGSLEEPERSRVQGHLASCPSCARELSEYRAAVELMPHALASASAPGDAWKAVSSRIRKRREPRQRSGGFFSRPMLQPALLAVLVAAVLGLIGWNASLQMRLSDRASALDEITGRRGGYTVVTLVPQPGVTGITGRVVMSHDRHEGGILVSGLPALPEGQAYQLWFVRPDQSRAPASTFPVDGRGQAVLLVNVPQPADNFGGVAITAEPQSGSPTPTGPDLLAGLIYAEPAS